MQGKTKGIFEDFFVLLIIVAAGWGGYMFFFSKEDSTPPVNTITQSQPSSQTIVELEPSINNKSSFKNNINTPDKKSNIEYTTPTKIESNTNKNIEKLQKFNEKTVEKEEIIQNTNIVSKKKVDLQVLQNFLITTKQNIKKSIDIVSKNNQTQNTLSIRVTVLKNGDFEQLVYTGGNKDIFKNNYENIKRVFPLNIDEKIVEEFPRYLRYSFKFSLKEE